jgi:uncharacterized protein YggE
MRLAAMVAGWVLVGVSGLWAPGLWAQTIQVSRENKTIAITATDSVEVLADTADISVGFRVYGTTQDQAYAGGSRVSNAVIKALGGVGITDKSIRSTGQELQELNDNDKARYAAGIRFLFYQTWTVTTAAGSAAEVLHTAITSGANASGAIAWRLADDDGLQAEAAGKALAHAKQIAEGMAAGLHAKLGALVYASNQEPERSGVVGMAGMAGDGAGGRANLLPIVIVPDKVTRSATVYAVFAIE